MCWWLWKSGWLGLRPGLDMAWYEFGDRRLVSRISTLPPVDLWRWSRAGKTLVWLRTSTSLGVRSLVRSEKW